MPRRAVGRAVGATDSRKPPLPLTSHLSQPAVEAQATDRAHRIGQTKSVFVYKLIAEGTVEERMLQLQADKRVLAGRLYTEKSASPTALAVEDLEMLFAP